MTNEFEPRWLTVPQIATIWGVSYKAAHSQLNRSGVQRRTTEGNDGKPVIEYFFEPTMPTGFRKSTKERGFHMGLSLEERLERASRLQEKAAARAARLIEEAKRKNERAAPKVVVSNARLDKIEETLETAKSAIDYLVDELVKVHDRLDALERKQSKSAVVLPWNPVRK